MRVLDLAHAGYGSPGVLMEERVDFIIDAHEHLIYRSKFEYQCHKLAEEQQ